MRFNSLINGLTALIGLSTLAAALPQASTLNERLTNAQLLARGKAPLKPAKLYDPSKVNVLRPRASPLPGVTVFSVAAGPVGSGGGTTKRDDVVPGYFSIDAGSLRFASNAGDAATFYFQDPSTQTRLEAVVSGQNLDVYAEPSGSVYLVKVGVAPAGSLTTFIGRPRYSGDLDISIPPVGSTTPQPGLWVRGSGGNLFLAPDYATAVAYDAGATVLLVQTFSAGQQASLAAATAAQGSSLRNPVRFWAQDAQGGLTGYLWLLPDRPQLVTYNSRSLASVFYLPNAGSAAQDQRALTTYKGQTLVGSLTPQAAGGYSYLSFNDVTASNEIINFNIPASGNGRVTFSRGSTPLTLFTTLQATSPYAFQFLPCPGTDAASCGTSFTDIEPICVEVVSGNTAPSVCQAWAREQLARDYISTSYLYLYDPAGEYRGYFVLDTTGSLPPLATDQMSATAFTLAASAVGQPQQELFAIIEPEPRRWRLGVSERSTGRVSIFPSPYSTVATPAIFNIPTDRTTTELTLRNSPADNAVPSQDWPFYYQGVRLVGCASPEYCPADRGNTRVCVELVPQGQSPQLCVDGWQVPV